MQRGKTKFFIKLFAFILFLSTLPIIFVGTFSYIKASDAIYKKVMQEKEQSIYQINTNVEQVLKTVDHSLTYFVNSTFLKDILKEPMEAEQFQNYRQLKHELNYLQTFDTGIEDILILSLEQQWLMNNDGLRNLDHLDIEMQFSDYFQSPSNTYWILERKSSLVSENSIEESEFKENLPPCGYSIKLVKQLPLITSKKTGLSIVSIPSCYLANILTSGSANENIMILDNQFRVLAHSDISLIGKSYADVPLIEKVKETDFLTTGQITANIDMTNYTITYRKSDYNGWIYLSVVSNKELKKEATAIGLFTLYVCLSILAGCLVFSWYGSKRLYKPINHLYKTMMTSIKTSSLQKQTPRDELEAIGDRIHHMLAENIELETKLHGQVDQLKHLFMVRLLDGQLGEEELLMKYLSYDFNEKWKQLCVLTLQIDSLENTKYTPGQKDLLLFTVNNIIEDIIPEDERLIPVLRRDVQVTVILSQHETIEEYEAYIHEIAGNIQSKVREELDLSISIGVSQPFSKLSQSRDAYLEGVEALKYRLKYGMNSILYYKNIETGGSLQTYFPENIKNELFDAIKLGEKEKVEETLTDLISGIFAKDLNPNLYQISLMRLLNDLILLMQTMGVELENLDDKKSLFDQLFELKSVDEIDKWFKDRIIFPLVTSLEERTKSQYKNISDKIIHIIQQEYDTDLTLEAIAERLHYNPNYLSSIFRKETNISFSEYVSMYRLNMAKKWLIESDLSIKEIAEMFQYNNSQNFIRSFKKKEGITPGKFRELNTSRKFE